MQVALHTDGLNECLSVDDTLRVLAGRTIHAFHIEGCGGGHVPNVLRLAGRAERHRLLAPTRRCRSGATRSDEHYEMIFAAHGLNHRLAERPPHWSRDRIRAGTMGAEDVLHDLGVIGDHLLATRRAWAAPARPCGVRSSWRRR